MTIDIAVVPVAGTGTSLLPLSKSQPKEMLSVGRKPVVQYVVEELAQSGIKRILFITAHGKSSIEQHFDIDENLIEMLRATGREDSLAELDYERRDIEYFYTRQRRQLGLGHAVLCAKPLVGSEPVVVALGDSIIGINATSQITRRMVDVFDAENADAVLALEPVCKSQVSQFGIADPAGDGEVMALNGVVEKPCPDNAPSNLSIAARYVFSPAIYEILQTTAPDASDAIQLTDAIDTLIKQGGKVLGVRLSENERRYDVGNFESYFQTFIEFALHDEQLGASIRDFVSSQLDSLEQ